MTATNQKIKVCFLPGRERGYARTRVLLKGMREAGIEVLDCACPDKSRWRYASSFLKFLKYKSQADVILVGFFGHFFVPLVKLFTRKKVFFDSFVSVHLTMVVDRKKFRPKGLLARLANWVDFMACHLADHVFAGTNQEITHLTRNENLDKSKFSRLWVGSDESVMYPRPGQEDEQFTVEFHGEFQHLHGVTYIVEAAQLLPDVQFQMFGRGSLLETCQHMVISRGIKNIKFIPPVPYEKLPEYIARTHVSLGIFGDTLKAQTVIPHKVFEAMAMGRTIITADTPAARELLTDRENVLFCRAADAKDLALKIKYLKNDPSARDNLKEGAEILFKNKCRSKIIGIEIIEHVKKEIRQ